MYAQFEAWGPFSQKDRGRSGEDCTDQSTDCAVDRKNKRKHKPDKQDATSTQRTPKRSPSDATECRARKCEQQCKQYSTDCAGQQAVPCAPY